MRVVVSVICVLDTQWPGEEAVVRYFLTELAAFELAQAEGTVRRSLNIASSQMAVGTEVAVRASSKTAAHLADKGAFVGTFLRAVVLLVSWNGSLARET